jgi:threonine dehydrogenase-like Zn-dependent dehydrogenase
MNSRSQDSAARPADERAQNAAATARDGGATSHEFRAPEYCADGSFDEAEYRFVGSTERGWTVYRNGGEHLRLGPGYRALRTRGCGICSTDLDRHFLPFPLPQVTGHEFVADDAEGRHYVVEINASHHARSVQSDCAFCASGLPTHCPERLVLGIHDLPGGFGSWILAPVDAVLPLPPEIPFETALLIEPFAASLRAVSTIAPRSGETIAVLGPRRLGLLVVAALGGHRKRSGLDFRILAISRHEPLLELASRLGATDGRLSSGRGASLPDRIADAVIDTTGSPVGLELAVRLARREVHLKSTHGQPSAGLANPTALVVDEIGLARLPQETDAGRDWLRALGAGLGQLGRTAKIAWLADSDPPDWLTSSDARVVRGGNAAELLADCERSAEPGELPRADAAVVQSVEQVDRAIRPSSASELSLVRPRGEIALPRSEELFPADSPLLHAVASRGLRLSSSRCGDFREAIDLIRRDPELLRLGELLVTHRFGAAQIREAFAAARSPECIKAVIEQVTAPDTPARLR